MSYIVYKNLYERCVTFVNNIITTLSYEEMTNTKVVDLDELFNLVFITFSAEIIWGTKILSEVAFFLKFKI